MTTLGNRSAQFSGLGPQAKFVVSDLEARTACEGLAINLDWTNPLTAAHTKIVRSTKQWPFDLTDHYDTVYDGVSIASFKDTGIVVPTTSFATSVGGGTSTITVSSSAGYAVGNQLRLETLTGPSNYEILTIASITSSTTITFTTPTVNSYSIGDRVSKSAPLVGNRYYYYLVLSSSSTTPATYDITDDTQAFGLSIEQLVSTNWLNRNTPRKMLELDAKSIANGGGGGFLGNWYEVMGCWLNLMRGQMQALQLVNNDDEAPFNVLTAKNISLGIQPEGFSYDYSIVRRTLLSLEFVYKQKGTCPGIVETVRMFTLWDAVCAEFGIGGCLQGPVSLQTYDGTSQLLTGTGTSTTISVSPGSFTDTAAAWTPSQFQLGQLVGPIGDIACVTDNTSNTLTLSSPVSITTTSVTIAAGSTTITVAATAQFAVTMQAEILDPTGTFGEIFEIQSIGSSTVLSTKENLANTYPAGSTVSIGKNTIRSEYTGTSTTVSGQVVTDTRATGWEKNQWVNYTYLDSTNVAHTIVSNTATTVTVAGTVPSVGVYSIAYGFTLGANFAARKPIMKYSLSNGTITKLYEPRYDQKEAGTVYDPFNRLLQGTGTPTLGAWGPNDVGVYITTPVTVIHGKPGAATGGVLNLDPTQTPPTANSLVGYYLNPNQNQNQLFQIVANTTTQVTVAGDISTLVNSKQFYYVLMPRDANRYRRLTDRLNREFTDLEIQARVLFF